jgi:hypothetical protein
LSSKSFSNVGCPSLFMAVTRPRSVTTDRNSACKFEYKFESGGRAGCTVVTVEYKFESGGQAGCTVVEVLFKLVPDVQLGMTE